MTKTLIIDGMSCNHCKMSVEQALADLTGGSASVDLAKKTATAEFTKAVSDEALKGAVEDLGFDVVSVN